MRKKIIKHSKRIIFFLKLFPKKRTKSLLLVLGTSFFKWFYSSVEEPIPFFRFKVSKEWKCWKKIYLFIWFETKLSKVILFVSIDISSLLNMIYWIFFVLFLCPHGRNPWTMKICVHRHLCIRSVKIQEDAINFVSYIWSQLTGLFLGLRILFLTFCGERQQKVFHLANFFITIFKPVWKGLR